MFFCSFIVEFFRETTVYRVLEVFKGRDAGLVEEVNQVRSYRNRAAHGRRTAKPAAVDPETAFRRLKEFLDVLGIGTEKVFETAKLPRG